MNWHPVISIQHLPINTMKNCDIDGQKVLVVNANGCFYAVAHFCTHDDIDLSLGCIHNQNIRCSLHGAIFSLSDGQIIEGPAEKPLQTWETKIKGDMLYVNLQLKENFMTLTQQTCVACAADAPLATELEKTELKAEIPDWQIMIVNDVEQLIRSYPFDEFAKATAFVNAVSELSDSEGHHPKITLEWGRVEVAWWSHKIKGLHKNDFIMAAKSDYIFINL